MTSPGIALALSYLSGSLPFAAIAGQARGVDLRKHGSGNLGATNVYRTAGRLPVTRGNEHRANGARLEHTGRRQSAQFGPGVFGGE